MEAIPRGHTKAEIKAREKLIKDFFVKWVTEHPEKRVWNKDLVAFIHVKFLSINETYEKAARNYKSTNAVFQLTNILEGAVKIGEQPTKRNVVNQKKFEKMIIMTFGDVKLTVGLQRLSQEYVLYCITVPSAPVKKQPSQK